MATFEKDFILRQIRQLVQLIARIVLRTHAEGQYASGLEEVRATMEGYLGFDYEMLGRIDPASAALLVHDGEALRTLAWIAAQEGELLEGAGDPAAAQDQRRPALALYAECAKRYPGEAAACLEAARALAAETETGQLAKKYRRWLEPQLPARDRTGPGSLLD